MSQDYARLMEPGRIGTVQTRNRIVKTGASMCYWHQDDTHMSELAKAYYGAVARGGVGLLIIESPDLDYPYGTRWKERYRIDDDRYVGGMAELAEAIHAHGCPTFVQLWHDGPWQSPMGFGTPRMFEGPPIGASPVNLDAPGDFHRDVPRALTIPEIEDLIDKFASAVVRIQKAGFDGVELNAGSSHLLHNFLSPFWNRREDEYGGSVENRARFTTTVVREIKNRCGADYPVSVLINGFELGRAMGIDDDTCLTHQQALEIARLLEEAGADALQVRNHWLGYHVGGFFPDYLFYPEAPIPMDRFPKEYNPTMHGKGANVHLAEALKRTVEIPVIVVGKLDEELGEQYLREGKADFIAMTRRIQADPELPNKVRAGAPKSVAPCTGCGTCLDQSVSMIRRCRVNACMGTEEYSLTPTDRPKKVVVVGGGPAGMEAARVAAARGHKVTLMEKSSKLGGLLPLAALVKGPEPEDLPPWIAYYERELRTLGVELKMRTKADAESISRLEPDAVVVATGGKLVAPPVKRSASKGRGPKIVTAPDLHHRVKPILNRLGPTTLDRLTQYYLPVGKEVVVIGGGFHGCEIAEFMIKRGRKVTIVEASGEIGTGVLDFRLGPLMEWFVKKGVGLFTGATEVTVTDEGVDFVTPDGVRHSIKADTVIPTAPVEPDTGLVEALRDRVPEVYAIGDCREAGMMVDAVAAGWSVAKKI